MTVLEIKFNPYTDCGQNFDHISDDKVANVSALVSRGCPKSVIIEKISKCELVCANCNALRTKKRGYYKIDQV